MSVNIVFLGDISLNDYYIKCHNKWEKPFAHVSPILQKSDYVVGNLECFLQSAHGKNLPKKLRLKTTAETLNYLKDLHINLVSLGNNHAYDNLKDGFEKTINTLDKLDIAYLGAGISIQAAQEPFFSAIKDLRFCFVNYVDAYFKPTVSEDVDVYLNWLELDKVKDDIQRFRQKADFVILLLHWGGDVEGLNYPSLNQASLAKQLVQFGADLIIGHHSHTFQPYEVIQGTHVFYSLGNFCFSDVFLGNRWIRMRDFRTGIVNIEFAKTGSYHVSIVRIKSEKLFLKLDMSKWGWVQYQIRVLIFPIIMHIPLLWHFAKLKCLYFDRFMRFIFDDELSLQQKFHLLRLKIKHKKN